MRTITTFGAFQNFKFSVLQPTLPVKDCSDAHKLLTYGGHSTVVLHSERLVLKISRPLKYDWGNELLLISETDENLLTPAPSETKAVVKVLIKEASLRLMSYQLISKYLPKNSVKLLGFFICGVPRKLHELGLLFSQAHDNGPLSIGNIQIVLSEVPNSEIALVEIWERAQGIDPEELDFKDLNEIKSREDFRNSMWTFIHGCRELLYKEGIQLDICKVNGIGIKSAIEAESIIPRSKNLIRMLKRGCRTSIPFPFNTKYSGVDGIVIYDILPFTLIHPRTREKLPNTELAIKKGDLSSFESNRSLFHYLILLTLLERWLE